MNTTELEAKLFRTMRHLYRLGFTAMDCLDGKSPFIVCHRPWLRHEPIAVLGIDKTTGRVTLLWWESATHRYLDARTKQPIGL